jgi:hypothetical protein
VPIADNQTAATTMGKAITSSKGRPTCYGRVVPLGRLPSELSLMELDRAALVSTSIDAGQSRSKGEV